MKSLDFYIGFDIREPVSFTVCKQSIIELVRHSNIFGIELNEMRERGFYNRVHEKHGGQLYDVISAAPMSTEFAITRFLVPKLSGYNGFGVFMDSDMMFLSDVTPILQEAVRRQPGKAVYCVKHLHNPDNVTKMDNQIQTRYACKNWSSFMLFNNEHPKNRDIESLINKVPGRDLHRFCWLDDDDIGGLPQECNYLVGHTRLKEGVKPVNVHWTDGGPELLKDELEYSREWYNMLRKSATIGSRLRNV